LEDRERSKAKEKKKGTHRAARNRRSPRGKGLASSGHRTRAGRK
jgi:hypothetical protein